MVDTWDAVVIGTGSVGAFALREYASRGLRALGIEQYSVAHDRGGAGGESRLLRVTDVRSDEIDWARRSRSELQKLGERFDRQLFTASGVLHISPAASGKAERMRSAAVDGEELEFFDATGLRSRFPRHVVRDDETGVLDASAGWVRPELTVATAIQHATELGATMRERTRAGRISRSRGLWHIDTTGGEVRAEHLIVTPGAWAGTILADTPGSTHVRRIVMTWFAIDRPSDFTGPRFPAWSRLHADGRSSFGAPTIDGASVKIALVESYGDLASSDQVSHSVTEDELDSVRELVRDSMDGVLPHITRTSVHMDLFSTDDEFRIHPLDADGTGVRATALSGRGFKIAPALGMDLARASLGDVVPQLTSRRGYAAQGALGALG